jgi:hypothetical protein
VLEIAPLSITYDVIACQSSTDQVEQTLEEDQEEQLTLLRALVDDGC